MNPFTPVFGEKPQQYIERREENEEIISSFSAEPSFRRVFMIIGIRGSGKTVMLADIADYFRNKKDWIVLRLSSDQNILLNAVNMLASYPELRALFVKAEINLSVLGLGVSFRSDDSFNEVDPIARRMLQILKKEGKKVLFIIDEVVNSEKMKEFASNFQIYMTEHYPVYLLMAGLYNNISNLQNQDTLTFLLRAPRIKLERLSVASIAVKYQTVFGISVDEAAYMAKLTKGYPYAFQSLGEIRWKKKDPIDKLMPEYDEMLFNVYEKLWSELSNKDKSIVSEIAGGMTKVKDLREKLGFSTQMINQYRKRLIDQGIVDGSERGEMKIALPRFENYIELYGVLEES